MKQTFTCDICKKAVDISLDESLVLNPRRCVITKNCRGTLSLVNANSVAPSQYATATIDGTAWSQTPMLYPHIQTGPRKIWLVNHGLNAQPMVQVYLDGATEAYAPANYSLDYITSTQLQITFDTAQTGVAECLIRPNTLPVVSIPAVAATANFPLAPNSILTIGIPYNTLDLVLNLYTDSANPTLSFPFSAYYLGQRLNTAWSDFTAAIINGHRYTICDINLNAAALIEFSYSASFTIQKPDGTSFIPGDGFVLCSQTPFQNKSDRVVNKCVSLASLADKNTTVFDSAELYCLSTLTTSVYPPIISL